MFLDDASVNYERSSHKLVAISSSRPYVMSRKLAPSEVHLGPCRSRVGWEEPRAISPGCLVPLLWTSACLQVSRLLCCLLFNWVIDVDGLALEAWATGLHRGVYMWECECLYVWTAIMGVFKKRQNGDSPYQTANAAVFCPLGYIFWGQTGLDVCLSAIAQGQAEFPGSAVLGTRHLSREIGVGSGGGLNQRSDFFPSLCILLWGTLVYELVTYHLGKIFKDNSSKIE